LTQTQKLNQVAKVSNVGHGDLITGESSCCIQDLSYPLTKYHGFTVFRIWTKCKNL